MLRPDFAEASTGRRAFTVELAEGQHERNWNNHVRNWAQRLLLSLPKHQNERDWNN